MQYTGAFDSPVRGPVHTSIFTRRVLLGKLVDKGNYDDHICFDIFLDSLGLHVLQDPCLYYLKNMERDTRDLSIEAYHTIPETFVQFKLKTAHRHIHDGTNRCSWRTFASIRIVVDIM